MSPIPETIHWHCGVPDNDKTVLMFCPSGTTGDPQIAERIWPGWFDAKASAQSGEQGQWFYIDGSSVTGLVTHWAKLPIGPNA